MSSDESRTTSSSRLSQFGLYRTIDARTEEFLRLSRKRQIRQGCACAAVSTALTVTVVVTVLLVYEYNINTESKTNYNPIRKPNWFGLVNDSSPFDVKYNKAKLNLDPTTLKLLPIILKALNHNRYLKRFLEDSSTSPKFENRDTIEDSYQTNVFPKIQNWIRTPNPKMYIEYRNSPIVNNKSSKKNLDFYMKNRKIRDYQRVLNYFDKMIGDKVVTSPPTKYYSQFAQPSLKNSTDPLNNHEETTQHVETETIESLTRTSRKFPPNCICPKNLGILINKLISSIHELLPEIMNARSPCKYEANFTTERPTTTTSKDFQAAVNDMMSKSTSGAEKLTLTPSSKPNKEISTFNTKKIYDKYMQNTLLSKKYDFKKHIANESFKNDIVKSNIILINENDNFEIKRNMNNQQTTTIKAYLRAPELDENVIPSFTEPMPRPTKVNLKNRVTTEGGRKLMDKVTATTQKQESQIYTINDDYNDFVPTTDVDVFDLEQIEKYISTGNKEIESRIYEKNSKVTDVPHSVNIQDLNLFTLRKMGDLVISNKKNKTNKEVTTKTENITKASKVEYELTTNLNKIHNSIKENMTKPGEETTTVKGIEYTVTEHSNKTSITDVNVELNITQKSNKIQHRKKSWEDEDVRFPIEDDIQDQEILNPVDNIIKTPIKYNKFDTHQTNIDSKMLNSVEHKESKPTNSKSMLPHSRPTYLEINRNHDWNHADNLDYETVSNQNIVFN